MLQAALQEKEQQCKLLESQVEHLKKVITINEVIGINLEWPFAYCSKLKLLKVKLDTTEVD